MNERPTCFLDSVTAKRDAAADADACAKRASEVAPGSAVRYALLGRAREQALQAGALGLALECAVAEVEGYRVDRLATLAELAEVAGKVRPRQQDTSEQRALLLFGVEWCGRALAAHEFAMARRFLAVAQTRIRRSDLREFGPRVRDLAGDLTLIDRFEPARASTAQASKVVDLIARCCAPASALDTFAEVDGSSVGEVARRDQEVSASVDHLLGVGTGAQPRPRGAPLRLAADNRATWSAKAKELAADWTAVAAESDLTGLSADLCWDRAGHWHARAIALAGSELEKLQLTTALAEFTKALPRRAYLADLEPKDVSEMPWCDGLQRGDTLVFNRASHPIRIDGVARTRSLGMHAAENLGDARDFVWARFVVPRQADWLRGGVAINDSGGPRTEWGPLVFEIWSGEQLVWWSRRLLAARVTEDFVVPVRPGSVVELRVRSEGRGAYGHAIWIAPYFLR